MTHKNAPAAAGAADEGQITTPAGSESSVIPITLEQWNAQHRAACDAFYEKHRDAIDAARPGWADEAIVDAAEGDEADLVYRKKGFGTVEFARAAEFVGGEVVFRDDSDRPDVSVIVSTEDLTAKTARALASDLLAAIPRLDEIEQALEAATA